MRDLTPEEQHNALNEMQPNPDPRLVTMLDFAIDQVSARITSKKDYSDWLEWAAEWQTGRHAPQQCIDVAHRCFDRAKKDQLTMWHTLGQLAWGAKEACYSTKSSPWYVLFYIADAMIAYGIAFPEGMTMRLEPPTIDTDVKEVRLLGG